MAMMTNFFILIFYMEAIRIEDNRKCDATKCDGSVLKHD